MAIWPSYLQLNVFGFDNILLWRHRRAMVSWTVCRQIPMLQTYLNMSAPPKPALAWNLVIDDSTMTWSLEPRGQSSVGAIMYALLLSIPIVILVPLPWLSSCGRSTASGTTSGVSSRTSEQHELLPYHRRAREQVQCRCSCISISEKGGGFLSHKEKEYHGDIIGWPEDRNKRRTSPYRDARVRNHRLEAEG